jgi:hypothetical protein
MRGGLVRTCIFIQLWQIHTHPFRKAEENGIQYPVAVNKSIELLDGGIDYVRNPLHVLSLSSADYYDSKLPSLVLTHSTLSTQHSDLRAPSFPQRLPYPRHQKTVELLNVPEGPEYRIP